MAELETTLAFYGASHVDDDHFRIARLMQNDVSEAEDRNEVFAAIRDLSLAASGHYVGATSNIAIGRMLRSVVQSQHLAPVETNETLGMDASQDPAAEDPSPKSMDGIQSDQMASIMCIDSRTADRLIQGWHCHISTRYPIILPSRVTDLHSQRAILSNPYDRAISNLIYAVSGRWLESSGETGYFFSDKHYDAAYHETDDILKLGDGRGLDYLLLMTLYCTRAPKDPGAWTFVGLAIRLCIELGLHRRRRETIATINGEMDKRRWWTAYFLERDICIAIGRPPSITDHDIDAELPLDLDVSLDSDELVQNVARAKGSEERQPTSNLTPFIHRTRLKRLESEIQHTVYRVDLNGEVSDSVITDFLGRLEQWRADFPQDAKAYPDSSRQPHDGLEFYTIHYHRCVRFLLYPRLTISPPNMHYLKLCTQANSGVISDYRHLHQVSPVGFSTLRFRVYSSLV